MWWLIYILLFKNIINLKKCQYLVTNTPDSGSAKNKQAKEYGIEIITEEDFFQKLKI